MILYSSKVDSGALGKDQEFSKGFFFSLCFIKDTKEAGNLGEIGLDHPIWHIEKNV